MAVCNIIIGSLTDENIEMAERKGAGHPDTICDQIAEQISVDLCKYYLQEFGTIMHHNTDKALLIAGQSKPDFKGGKIIKPFSLILAGRATHKAEGKIIPVDEIAVETAKKWLRKNIRQLDITSDVQVFSKIGVGSGDLAGLFSRFGKSVVPLANDTSFGAGYYPMSNLEKSIVKIEELLNSKSTKNLFPYIGEDIKVMGVKDNTRNYFTIAIAVVDKYVADLNDYISKIKQVKEFVHADLLLTDTDVFINTADDYGSGSIYLTVNGTSAENGDDGQVGRGNRLNGLITPYRPMSLEAVSGKNPVNHVGKIYNYFAMDLSRAIVENQFAEAADVFIVSQIAKPINEPQLVHVKLKNRSADKNRIEDLVQQKLNSLSGYWEIIIDHKRHFDNLIQ